MSPEIGSKTAAKKKPSGRPFTGRDDIRLNKNGRPPIDKSLRESARSIAEEFVDDPEYGRITRREKILRDMAANPKGRDCFLRAGYGDYTKDLPEPPKPNPPECRVLTLLPLVKQDFITGKVHRFVGNELEKFRLDFINGYAPALDINLPPRSGKTTLAEGFVAMMLRDNPKLNVAWIGYNSKLARRSSAMVKSILSGTAFTSTWGDILSGAQTSTVDNWRTSEGGGLIARGFKSGVEGENIGLIVLDDICKEYQAYLSPAMRDQYDLFFQTLTSRFENETAVLSIGRRWGKNDTKDKAREMIPRYWRSITIPAIAGENDILRRQIGEAIFPEKANEATLEQIKKTLGDLEWQAFYQQDPVDKAGAFFDKQKFNLSKRVDQFPALKWYRYYDPAVSEDRGDETGSALVGIDFAHHDDIYIRHVSWCRREWPKIEEMIDKQRIVDGSAQVCIESNGTQKAFPQILRARGISVLARPSKPDKITDAALWQSKQLAGDVYLPSDGEGWVQKVMDCAHEFPNGKHDDIIDAISGAIYMARKYRPITVGGRS